MAFKTKNERYAYVRGLKAGAKGKKPFGHKKSQSKKNSSFVKDILQDLQNQGITDLNSDKFVKWCRQNDFVPSNIRHEISISNYKPNVKSNKTAKYDYSTNFDFDSKGKIKGSYTADGFFEPD